MANHPDPADNSLILEERAFTDRQLWTIEKVPGNETQFYLINSATGKYAGAGIGGNGTVRGYPIFMVPASPGVKGLIWSTTRHDDGWYDMWTQLSSEQKLNANMGVSPPRVITWGWDGGAQNEKWKAIADFGYFRLTRFHLDMDKATDSALPAVESAGSEINNSCGDAQLTQAIQLTRSEVTSSTFTVNRTTSVTNEIAFEGSAKVGGKYSEMISGEISAKTSWKKSTTTVDAWGSSETKSETDTISSTVTIVAPPHSRTVVSQVVTYAQKNVPFTATIERTSTPNGTALSTIDISGVLHRVSATNYSIEQKSLPADGSPCPAVRKN